MQLVKRYLTKNVLEAALERVAFVFERFEHVYVSVSGGKDSTVIYRLCRDEAERRGRKVHVFFLDQEAEYQATVDIMREIMAHPAVVPCWYQVPLWLTNATSYAQDMLHAWGEGEEWMRAKEPNAVRAIDGAYPQRFYDFFEWFERTRPAGAAHIVGLRAEEGINRFRAVTKNPGYEGVKWSTKGKGGSVRFYPVYDWGMGDVWRYILDNHVPYNRVYDLQYARNHGVYNTNRVSNLIHEMSFSCLTDLPALEPETYAKLVRRLEGVHCAAHHAKGALYDPNKLPEAFATWREYRDHVLAAMPIDETKKVRFRKRFATQGDSEGLCRQQVRRLLINDYENNVPVTGASKKRPPRDHFARWRKLF